MNKRPEEELDPEPTEEELKDLEDDLKDDKDE